jgi:sugar lactone lactonase YvrE
MINNLSKVFPIQKTFTGLLLTLVVSGCGLLENTNTDQNVKKAATLAQLETVLELPFRPGNVSATKSGRVFATVHPFAGEQGLQLLEVTGPNSYQPWPSSKVQSPKGQYSENTIDTPLGITKDKQGGLWIVDMGLHIGKTRIWGFDIDSGELISKIVLPTDIAPANSFVQDLVVDRERGWVYLADLANPGILAVELATNKVRRFGNHPSLKPEVNAKMVINGQAVMFGGKPANTGINPITLSADGETLFFGAMNGRTWYSVPAKLFRDGVADDVIAHHIKRVGEKPISDGATTDSFGNHFITNLNENGIDKLSANGVLTPLIRDARLNWPDNVSADDNGWLYISVNQLHKSPRFSDGADIGKAPYYIYRVWANTQ